MQSIDLETFQSLDRPTRHLVLRLLDEPTETDWVALDKHPNGKMLASWLLELPAYSGDYSEED
ncbi:hypothetical protein [Pimelobacter simplex]|uniref:hypothetical protein n=1 Tax=Nocardioides simplex TaxID=2045 RepID=UPI00193364C1|nr:hypothetical protein [Pimelobacter simplex]